MVNGATLLVVGLMTLVVNGETEIGARLIHSSPNDVDEALLLMAELMAKSYTPETWATHMVEVMKAAGV